MVVTPSVLLLTTTQVAQLLDVHPSTVKRWCNDDELALELTEGGHRRIGLATVLSLATRRGITTYLDGFAPYAKEVWSCVQEALDERSFDGVRTLSVEWLRLGHLRRIAALFQTLGSHPEIDFARFCDDAVRGFMQDVGEEWRAGRLRVGEEHMASGALTEVLTHLRSTAPLPLDQPRGVAVVGSMEGVRHALGAWCVRLLLERRGWEVFFLGADVPLEDYASIQRGREASLVCVSFSAPTGGADMARAIRVLGQFYDGARPYTLALGGDLQEPAPLEGLEMPFVDFGVFETIRAFDSALSEAPGLRVLLPTGAVG